MAKKHSFADVIQSHRESSHPVTQVPKSLGTEESKPSAKSTNKEYVKLTAYVPKELHRAAKSRLVAQGREISDLIEDLVSAWLTKETGASQT